MASSNLPSRDAFFQWLQGATSRPPQREVEADHLLEAFPPNDYELRKDAIAWLLANGRPLWADSLARRTADDPHCPADVRSDLRTKFNDDTMHQILGQLDALEDSDASSTFEFRAEDVQKRLGERE